MAGAGVYTYQLVRALADVAREHSITVFARRGLFDDLVSERFAVVPFAPSSRGGRLLWEQARLPLLLRSHRIDVLHSPHHHTPLLALGVPRVVTIHDVTFLLLPERYPRARRLYMSSVTRAAARVAAAVITPSETVRRDVIDMLHLLPERVVAVLEAAGPQYVPATASAFDAVSAKYALPARYALSVGSLEPGKNRARLFRVLARLRDEGLECPLVIAGQPAWQFEGDDGLVRDLRLSELVTFLGYVPDDDLPALYTGATLFAFPSLYEGFGLPVLEAMACGTPVLTSSVSATAEAAGDAALLVDPLDIDAIAAALRRLLTDEALHGDLRRRGFERAKEFSWQRAARETLAVYEAVAAR